MTKLQSNIFLLYNHSVQNINMKITTESLVLFFPVTLFLIATRLISTKFVQDDMLAPGYFTYFLDRSCLFSIKAQSCVVIKSMFILFPHCLFCFF